MFHTLCHLSEIPLGEKKLFEVGDHKLLVFHLDDGVYATEARCPHLFKSLAKGEINKDSIQCPMHRATFDIKTGKNLEWANFPKGIQLLNKVRPQKNLRTYELILEGNVINLKVPRDMFL